jgi:AcrR family transcriptional regulator
VKEASRLFRERGFENVTVGEVMKAAGVAHGAIHAHFDSKEELQAAAVAFGQKGLSVILLESRSAQYLSSRFTYCLRTLIRFGAQPLDRPE